MNAISILQVIVDFFTPETKIIGNHIVYEGIAWLIPAITLALSAASTIYSNEQTKKAESEKNKLLKERQGSIDAWYKEQSRPFLDTESGKSLQALLTGGYEKIIEANRNNAIAGGATAESQIATRGKALESFNNTILGAAANSEGRRLATNSQYQNQLTDILNRKEAGYDANTENWMNTMTGIQQLLQGVNTAYGEGAFG